MLVFGAFLVALAAALPPQAEDELQAALAEADQLDPGWRPEEIEASQPSLADADNSAVCVREVCERLPPDWPDSRLLTVQGQPPRLLREDDVELLRRDLARAETAREEARRLADLPRGHFPLAVKDVPLPAMPFQCARTCAGLLEWQAWLQAQEKDAEGALLSLRCMVHAGASIDDEPFVLAQLVRRNIQEKACAALAVILAQTQPGDAALERVEKVLRREQAHPLFLWMMRGERIWGHLVWTRLSQGRLSWSIVGAPETSTPASAAERAARDAVRRQLARAMHPHILRFCNRAVEIARVPTAAQWPLLQALQPPSRRLEPSMDHLASSFLGLGQLCLTSQAKLSCARVAVAVERYRLRHRRWPGSLRDVVPDLLPAIPRDPFDGRPFSYRRLADGVVISPASSEEGGALAPVPASARSFRLWDPGQRRQEPGAPSQGEVFGFGPGKVRHSCFLHPRRERSF